MESTREKILDIAESLIHSHGYLGFSYADIADILNVKNAAIHYHFKSKEELGVAVLITVQDRFGHWKRHLQNNSETYQKRFEAFMKIYDSKCYSDNKMCLVGSFCSDFYQLPNRIQEGLKNLITDISIWLIALLRDGRECGEFNFQSPPKDLAAQIQSGFLGAVMLNRPMGHKIYEQIKKQLIINVNKSI